MTQERTAGKKGARQPGTRARVQPEPVLGGLVQDAISRSLQAHYNDIVSAPVPDKFLLLLAQLEEKESRGDS